jgi:hypothetical protein
LAAVFCALFLPLKAANIFDYQVFVLSLLRSGGGWLVACSPPLAAVFCALFLPLSAANRFDCQVVTLSLLWSKRLCRVLFAAVGGGFFALFFAAFSGR